MRNWLRVIAAIEVVGGAFGVGFVILALLSNPVSGPSALLAVFVLAVNALCFVAGAALWSGSRAGRVLSVIVQVIQLPKVVSSTFIFIFSFGLDAWLFVAQAGPRQGGIGFHLNVLASSQLFFNSPVGSYNLAGVSLTSIAFLAVLLGYKGEAAAEASEPPGPPPPPHDWQQPE